MSKEKNPIEFGANGAGLNSGSISDELAKEYIKPRNHWSDALLFKPAKWPPSALVLALGAAILLGMRLSIDGESHVSRWLEAGSLVLIVTAGWWRVIWQEHFDK